MTEDHDRFVTIAYFVKEMLGMKARNWYYDHQNDPGVPQRVMVGDKPKLSFQECLAYMERLKEGAKPAAPPKRNVGRPRKIRTPPSAAA